MIGRTMMLNLIIKDYLQNMKERGELDYIFPILLEQMNFTVVKTAKSSHGQPEYGKDIVAIRKGKRGKTLFIFQLKAGKDKDISISTFSGNNGIRESLIQARYVDYTDSSIPELNNLPRRIILVHPGEIQSNFRPVFEGFINTEFPDDNFERWDISILSEYFSKYMLHEYILSNIEHVNLLKKALVFIDVPENDFKHFRKLIKIILSEQQSYNPSNFKKMMSTLCLIAQLILKYSEESGNLIPARECLTFLLLQTWGWILEKKVESNKKVVIAQFLKLQKIHFIMMEKYLSRIIPIATKQDGLFSEGGGHFEEIGYPLRCFDFIGYLVYHLYSYRYFWIDSDSKDNKHILHNGAIILNGIITHNCGCSRPLLDNHSIPIILSIKYLHNFGMKIEIKEYLKTILNHISLIKSSNGRLPELYNNVDSLIDFVAIGKRPTSYSDKSSYLLLVLFELLTKFNMEYEFNEYWDYLTKDIHLLSYYPPDDIIMNEHILFQKELVEEGGSDVYSHRDEFSEKEEDSESSNYDIFKHKFENNKNRIIEFRTDKVGFSHLRYLAHVFNKTPLFFCDID